MKQKEKQITYKQFNKMCEHEWHYSNTVSFDIDKRFTGHYRIIHHCRKCGQLDIQTIYR